MRPDGYRLFSILGRRLKDGRGYGYNLALYPVSSAGMSPVIRVCRIVCESLGMTTARLATGEAGATGWHSEGLSGKRGREEYGIHNAYTDTCPIFITIRKNIGQ